MGITSNTATKRTYCILWGDEPMVRQYGGVHALPETLVIDREGRIAAKHVGVSSKTDYERKIGELLGPNIDPHLRAAGMPEP